MIKVLVFIKKRDGISLESFIRHYEEVHVPLVEELLPMYAGYRRNYLTEGIYPAGVAREFDVVTELLFADSNAYADWLAALEDPAVLNLIRKDEENFIDSSQTIMWTVDAQGQCH
ncbi:MAG: EthD domain-containing protein [Porticoccaceae bacterium]|nr:EthD domain-containing protein [Porticoccaceae bacterium]